MQMDSNDFLAEIVVCSCESLIWFAVFRHGRGVTSQSVDPDFDRQ